MVFTMKSLVCFVNRTRDTASTDIIALFPTTHARTAAVTHGTIRTRLSRSTRHVVVSFLVAWAVVAAFLPYVKRHMLKVFGYYRVGLGTIILIVV